MSDHADTEAERAVQPEIPRSRFALGMADYPQDMAELHLGRFSEGQQTARTSDAARHRGRFSQGQELLGEDDPEKHIRRRFDEGMATGK